MICLWTTWFLLKKKGTRSFLSLLLLFPAITCLTVWISIHNLIINSSRAMLRKGFSICRRTQMCLRIRKRQMNTKFNLLSNTRIQLRTISKNSILTMSPQLTWINTMTFGLMRRWKRPKVSFESKLKIIEKWSKSISLWLNQSSSIANLLYRNLYNIHSAILF